jgi:hypothetical protein
MNRTEYAEGFMAGRLFERRAITDFIEEHRALGVEVSLEDIELELSARNKTDKEIMGLDA